MPCWWATMKSSANRSSMRLAKLWYCPSREEFSTSWITGEIWRGRDIKWKSLAAELLISGPQGPSCFWTTAVSILLTIVTSQLCCTCLTKWRKLWPKRWQNRWRKWQKKGPNFTLSFCLFLLCQWKWFQTNSKQDQPLCVPYQFMNTSIIQYSQI